MTRLRVASMAVVIVLVASACASGGPPVGTLQVPTVEGAEITLDPKDFTDGITIDNKYWPLVPGTRMIWEGEAFEDGERVERRIVFTMTDLTKQIGGITTAVGWDRDFNNGILGEAEIIFLAQNNDGDVWHFGQYRENFAEDGEFEGGRAWLYGLLAGVEPGILMKGNPQLDAPDYSQGFAPPPYNWDDRAKVEAVGEKVCVPAGCYDDVLVMREFERSKPDAYQLKYYAPGVGNIKVGWGGKAEKEKEVLELVEVIQLTPDEMLEVRDEALALENRAYVYGRTPPLQPRA